MATVYLARDSYLDRDVAIMVLSPSTDESLMDVMRTREARIHANLDHPNIIAVYECDYEPTLDCQFIVMEYAGGGTLEEAYQKAEIPLPLALMYMRQLTEALTYAHSEGIIHRDIKPKNILLSKRGVIKLSDFGIAKNRNDSGVGRTLAGMMTEEYASPEQLNKESLDHRTDIYSLGLVFAALLLRTPLPKHQSALEVLINRLPNYPTELLNLINGMICADKAGRPTLDTVLGVLASISKSVDHDLEITTPDHPTKAPFKVSDLKWIANRYKLLSAPRTGTLSQVFKARDTETDHLVAVKLFMAPNVEDKLLTISFEREIKALMDLQHPNIAQFLTHGVDQQTSLRYVVMEWVESDIDQVVIKSGSLGWDDFYGGFGKQLLEALSFAHDRGIAHRDIGPQNVLIASDGTLKLADFGISKLKCYLQPGATLAAFSSPPYSPSEHDDGSFTYSRDVYAFAVLALQCMSEDRLTDLKSIESALETVDLPTSVLKLFQNCLSTEPDRRPHNAIVLRSLLANIQSVREQGWVSKSTCSMFCPPGKQDALKRQVGAVALQEAYRILENDLAQGIHIGPHHSGQPENYYALGYEYAYNLAIDRHARNRLVLFGVNRVDAGLAERRKEGLLFTAAIRFCFGEPADRNQGKEACELVQRLVEDHQTRKAEADAAYGKTRCLSIWQNFLAAQKELEKQRFSPLKYDGMSLEGQRAIFVLDDYPDTDLTGQQWRIRIQPGKFVIGEIETIDGYDLTLYVKSGPVDDLPFRGQLEYDIHAAEVALSRQVIALDLVKYDRAARADAANLLTEPINAKAPATVSVSQFFNPKLDSSKRKAVELAMGTEDVLIVHGPPGTGKTTFISETILQYVKAMPSCRILLSSQTHVALDNALEKVLAEADVKAIRLGKATDPRISGTVRHVLIDQRLIEWKEEVAQRSADFLTSFAIRHGISTHDIIVALCLEELRVNRKDISNWLARVSELKETCNEAVLHVDNHGSCRICGAILTDPVSIERGIGPVCEKHIGEVREYKPLPTAESIADIHDETNRLSERIEAAKRRIDEIKAQLTKIGADEADLGNLDDAEIQSWITMLTTQAGSDKLGQLIKLQAEWLEIFGRTEDFHEALVSRSQVVSATCVGLPSLTERQRFDLCIVDEASKATAPETLIPLSRSKKWILVGDAKQLPPVLDELENRPEILQKYNLSKQDIKETLFDYLSKQIPPSCGVMLAVQHRMVPEIGNLISECFYAGELRSASKVTPDFLQPLLAKPVTWISTSGYDRREELHSRQSYANATEARVILDFLDRLNRLCHNCGNRLTVAVLTGYSGQKHHLKNRFQTKLSEWANLTVDCNTVDAFQGREADLALFSVTRSNSRDRLGFLASRERINVALSRGKYALVVVGDHLFCRNSRHEHPLKDVLQYIVANPQTCTLKENRCL